MTRKVRFKVELPFGSGTCGAVLQRDTRDRCIQVSGWYDRIVCLGSEWVDKQDLLRRLGFTPLELRSIARGFEQQDKKAKQLARSLKDKKRKDRDR